MSTKYIVYKIVKIFVIAFFFILIILLLSCNHHDDHQSHIILKIEFEHHVDGIPVIFDSMVYVNEAGNPYEVTEVQWFISDISLISNGEATTFQQDDNIHYIDTNQPATWSWIIGDQIVKRDYQEVHFTFGLIGEKNTIGKFTDPPESNMMWPVHLGGDQGGYHYMKLNGFWLDTAQTRTAFNFHLGVGRVEDEEGNVISYEQNWFEGSIDLEHHNLDNGDTLVLPLIMNMENWFKNPNTWNHNLIGPKIMKNQIAMKKGLENGAEDVFTLGVTEVESK